MSKFWYANINNLVYYNQIFFKTPDLCVYTNLGRKMMQILTPFDLY